MTRKRVTMKDIADRLNLSINAVSLALNDKTGVGEETKRLILNTAEEMGYLDQSVKYMQNYSNKNICVLLKNRFFRDFRFYGRVLLGIEEEAKKAGYDVFFSSFETEDIPTCVESRKVAGIIAVGKIGDSFLRRLKEYDVPIVLADYNSLEETVDCLMSDNKLGSYKMASYLYKKGFRKIGYVGDLSYSPSTRERFYGYQEAIQNCFGLGIISESIEYIQRYSILTEIEDMVIHQNKENLYKKFMEIPEKPDAQIAFDEAKNRLKEAEAAVSVARKSAADLQDESTAELEANISDIDRLNIKIRANMDREKAEIEAEEYSQQYDELTKSIEDIREQRLKLLESADLPLPELSVENGELVYRGNKWDNMSGSEQLKVATAIVRKLNPNCGFVLMDKLEQMDQDTLNEFGKWLEQEQLQVIATRVSSGKECSVIIEDGYVKEYNGLSDEGAKTWKKGEF